MKQVIISTLLLILATSCFAQTEERPVKKIYLQLGTGATTNNGFSNELSIQSILKHNWSITFSYHKIEADAKKLPSDYEPGYTILVVFPVYDPPPSTDMKIFSLTAGKNFPAGRKIWFTTEAGLSVVSSDQLSFTPQPVEATYWLIGYSVSSNYSIQKENKTVIGGMLKADFNWAILPFIGLGAGAFANLNSIQSPVGFQVKLILGWMNYEKKHSK